MNIKMTIKECTQTKCCFHKNNGHPELCPRCNECDCPPHYIDENCVNCWNCLKDEGFVRSGNPELEEKQDQKQIIMVKND